ncbi:hypothetical protein RBS60_12340 [Sinomonas sp. ASV486]|uniref:DUF6541 family protein n=1 Tax=Sinomonas sp. ASV486 TaxID=3051170 RepID=UPI0027DBFC97|nr:DUF6541 family protein [Sinomonas sp. ASV486]MDQ4490983.1 hypothetical protein [Sinomonas sp. ASV486]
MAALAVVLVPGGLVALAAGLRGLGSVAVVPLFTATVTVIAAEACAAVRVPWGPGPLLLVSLVVAAAVFTVRRRFFRPSPDARPERPRVSGAEWAGLGIGAVGQIVVLSIVWGSPNSISQTIDAVFHLNAIRWIEVTGSASSLSLGQMIGSGFYPAGWHALVSATALLGSLEPPAAIFCSTVAFAAAVWVPGCVWLSRQVVGEGRAVPVVAGLAATAFGAFPVLLVDFGVLFPNMLVVAMLPACLALLVQALRLTTAAGLPPLQAAAALAFALPGVALVHPSGIHALVAFGWPPFAAALWRMWRARRAVAVAQWPVAAATTVAIAITGALWVLARPDPSTFWNPWETRAQAVGEAFTVAPMGQASSPVAAILLVVGAVVLLRRRRTLWAVGTAAVAIYLFVNVSAIDALPIRRTVTGPWYNDPYRLAALLPVALTPLIVAGVLGIARWAACAVPWNSGRTAKARRAALVVAVAAFAVGQGPNVVSAVSKAKTNYVLGADAPLLSKDERALLERIPTTVPTGARLLGNPWTGTSLVFALADREPEQFHLLARTPADVEFLDASLKNAKTDPRVCRVVQQTGVRYVLDFGTREIGGGTHHSFDGLRFLDSDGVARVVDHVGDARLLEITACA